MAIMMTENQIDELAKSIASTRMNGMNLNNIDEFINTYLDVYDAAKMIITERERKKINGMNNLSLDDAMSNETDSLDNQFINNGPRMSL